jgi:hypothetical protein
MAIFSIIMYSAVQLLVPVSKFFVRSSNFENTTACMDNMRRCIEGNLKYADRVRAYNGFEPYDASYNVTDDLKDKVQSFYKEFFEDRKFIDSGGTINVLVFDNRLHISDAELAAHKTLSWYADKQQNQGELVLIQYKFDNYGYEGAPADADALRNSTPLVQRWCVNQKLYSNFDYSFKLRGAISEDLVNANTAPLVTSGTDETTTTAPVTIIETDSDGSTYSRLYYDDSDTDFNPRDFTIQIDCREILRSSNGLIRQKPTTATVASFSMKNVLDAADGYRTPAKDYVPVMDAGYIDETADHVYRAHPVARYKNFQTNTGEGAWEGFYFIFTIPEEMHDVAECTGANGVYHDEFYDKQVALISTTDSTDSTDTTTDTSDT